MGLRTYPELSAIIIEDSPTKMTLLEGLLEALSVAQNQTYSTGEEAISQLNDLSEHHVIFLDLMLPGINGQQILQHLAQNSFKGFVVINSVCEERIVKTAIKVAATSGVRLLGSIDAVSSIEQIDDVLSRCGQPGFLKFKHEPQIVLQEQDIYDAFDQDLLEPFYQPIVNFKTKHIVALECLARIRDQKTGFFLTPVSFLSRIIDIAFLENLALRMFQKSLDHIQNPMFATSKVKLALNLDPTQFRSTSFPTNLHALTEKAGFDPDRVILELTEQAPVEEARQLEAVNILRLHGYPIAIDDFSSGYTNIQNLHFIPFNILEVDQQLLTNVQEDNFSQVALESIISMAREVNADVVFEGIENEEQLVYSSKFEGVNLQGLHVCESLQFDALLAWISKSPYQLAA